MHGAGGIPVGLSQRFPDEVPLLKFFPQMPRPVAPDAKPLFIHF